MEIVVSRDIDAGYEILLMLCRLANSRRGCSPDEDRMRVASEHLLGVSALAPLRPALDALTALEEDVLSAVEVDDERLTRLFSAPPSELQPVFSLYKGLREGLSASQATLDILLALQGYEAEPPEADELALDAFVREAMRMGFDRDYVLNLTQILACWEQEKAWLTDLLARATPHFHPEGVQPLVDAWADALEARLPEIERTGEVCGLLSLNRSDARYEFMPELIGFNSLRISLRSGGCAMIVRYGVLVDTIAAAVPGVQDSQLITRLRALGDKRRLQIVRALMKQPCYAGEIAELTQLSPATVSHHMSELLNAQLVSAEDAGNRVLYHLSEDGLRMLIADLSAMLKQ